MSTAEAPAPAAVPTTPFKLTKGGAYLVEGLLQRTEYTTTVPLTRKASRLRRKIRAANPCKKDDLDFERPFIRGANQTDIEWAQTQKDRNILQDAWENEEVVLELTQKEVDFLRHKALKWAFTNRDKVFAQNNDHVLSIIEAFDLEDDGE